MSKPRELEFIAEFRANNHKENWLKVPLDLLYETSILRIKYTISRKEHNLKIFYYGHQQTIIEQTNIPLSQKLLEEDNL